MSILDIRYINVYIMCKYNINVNISMCHLI